MLTDDLVVEVRDVSLERVGQFTAADLDGLTVVARANGVGSWQITLPDTVLDDRGREVPHALSAALREPGAGLIATGPEGVILSGPATEAKFTATDGDVAGSWTITGVSDSILLADALAYPEPSNPDPAAQAVSNDTRTGHAESLLRSYVAANIADDAPVERRVGFRDRLSVGGADLERGPVVTYSPRFDNLLELAQRIAVAGGLLFDVRQAGDALELVVWEPADRSGFVRMDLENGQLSGVDYGYGSPTATRPIVAGQGEGADRTILERTSAEALAAEAAWGRRIERFVDQRQTDDPGELATAGDEVLAGSGSTVSSVQATPSDDLGAVYGLDWELGDTVAIVVGDAEPKARVSEVTLIVREGLVLLGATLGDPVGFEPEALQTARVSSTESRVSSLERNAEGGGGVVDTLPAGTILAWGAETAPGGWLLCDGAAVSRSDFASLFAAIGTTYGAGDGYTTFNVPDLRGRVPVGLSADAEFDTLGKAGGAKTHTLTIAEMPSHTHPQYVSANAGGSAVRNDYDSDTNGGVYPQGISTGATGGGGAHNNLQPYRVVTFIIKVSVGTSVDESQLAGRVAALEAASGGTVRPAFQVTHSTSFAGSGAQALRRLNFGVVQLNEGGAWDPSAFRFIAPVDGVYEFTLSMTQATAVGGPEGFVYVNGSPLSTSSGVCIAYQAYVTATGTRRVALSAGDYVEAYWRNNNGTTVSIDGTRSSFAGHLI